MRKVCAKMVPKNLKNEHKANRRDVCLDLLDCLEREPEFFSCVITGDESWILEYCFFDSQGIVHKEFVPPGQTVNQTFIGKSLKDSGKGWHVCDQALHALGCCTTTRPMSHGSLHQWIFGRKRHSCGSSAPPYLLGLSPCDFFLFPRLKTHLTCYYVISCEHYMGSHAAF